MGWSLKSVAQSGAMLACLLIAGCSDNMNRAFYDGLKNKNDAGKSPNERAMTTAPNYGTYQKERESLKRNDPAEENNLSPASGVK